MTSRGKLTSLRVTSDASDLVRVCFTLIAVSRKLNERANGRAFA